MSVVGCRRKVAELAASFECATPSRLISAVVETALAAAGHLHFRAYQREQLVD